MEKLLNVENDWDGEVGCPDVLGPHCHISEEEVAAAIKGSSSSCRIIKLSSSIALCMLELYR